LYLSVRYYGCGYVVAISNLKGSEGTWNVFPGLVKAGKYYSSRGKEFWCFVKGKKPLLIEIDNNSFKRLVLGVDQNEYWNQRLSSKI
jgi:hypothetical protein